MRLHKMFAHIALATSIAFSIQTATAETLKMGINSVAPPFAYQGENGDLTGFEIELMQAIGEVSDFEIQVVPIVFSSAFSRLEGRDYDFLGHVYGTEERKQNYWLIENYNDPFGFIKLESNELENPLSDNSRISVISFSPQDDELKKIKQEQIATLEISAFDTNFLAFKNLFLNKSDFLLAPKSEIHYLTGNHADYGYQAYELPKEYVQTVSVNYLMLKKDENLYKRIRDGLEKVKASGVYDQLVEKYNL